MKLYEMFKYRENNKGLLPSEKTISEKVCKVCKKNQTAVDREDISI